MTRSAGDICANGAQLLRQFTAGQNAVRLPVLLSSGVDYLRWQLRPWRGFGPAHPFEVIPHKLFVKGSLRSTGRVVCGGPEARRVWRQRLVNPNQFVIRQAELEFCVGDDNSARLGMRHSALVELQANGANLPRNFLADHLLRLLKRDIFIVPAHGLRRGCENRFWQPPRFEQPVRERNAANSSGGAVILPSRARDVSPHHALNRQRVRLSHQHGPPCQFISKLVKRLGKLRRADYVIGYDILQKVEPEKRKQRKYASLIGNWRWQDHVERREPVRGHDQQLVAQLVNVAHLAAHARRQPGELSFPQDFHGRSWRHRENLPTWCSAF